MNTPPALMLIIWHKDAPVTGNVVPIKQIQHPRKNLEDYRVGDEVTARCHGIGVHTGIIGKIGDDKAYLGKILVGPDFTLLVQTVLGDRATTGADHHAEHAVDQSHSSRETTPPSDTGATQTPGTTDNEVSEEGQKKKQVDQTQSTDGKKPKAKTNKQPPVKRQLEGKLDKEAKQARLEERHKKTAIDVCRQANNIALSSKLLEEREPPTSKLNEIAATLTTLVQQQQELREVQHEIITKLDAVAEMATCPKCVKAIYKECSRKNGSTPTPGPIMSPKTPKSIMAYMVPNCKPSSSPSLAASTSAPPRDINSPITIDGEPTQQHASGDGLDASSTDVTANATDVTAHAGDTSNGESDIGIGLVYLGETRYGVTVPKDRLHSARVTSKDATKYALNLLESIVTRAECRDKLTLTGEGRGAKPMEHHKTQALKSEIFAHYHTNEGAERRNAIWKEDIAPSLNNKIRGIRNGKYPGVPE